MGLQTVPGFIGQTGYEHPVELDRNWMEALAGGRSGAYRYNDFALTPSGSALQMAVAAGHAVLVGSESAQQGAYFAWSDASENIAWPSPSGSTRIDSLILRVVDTQYGSDPGQPRAEWQVVQGVAGSGVARPDSDINVGGSFYKPGAWLRWCNVTLPSTATTLTSAGVVVTHLRKYARVGRHVMCLTADKPSDPQLGDTITLIEDGQTQVWNGSAWAFKAGLDAANLTGTMSPNRLHSHIVTGQVIVPTTAGVVTSVTWTFGRTLSATPRVFAVSESTVPGTVEEVTTGAPSTTQATIYVRRTTSVNTTVMCLAMAGFD